MRYHARVGIHRGALVVGVLLGGCLEPHPSYLGEGTNGGPGSSTSTATTPTDGSGPPGSGTTTSGDTDGGTGSGGSGTTTSGDTDGGTGSGGSGTTTSGATATGGGTGTGEPHVVFVSSLGYTANLGGLAGADAKCQSHADGAGLGGTWMAILSTEAAAVRDRLSIVAPVVDIAGAPIAASAADLWDATIENPIGLDENGQPYAEDVWTGSLSDGTAHEDHCLEWQSDAPQEKGIRGMANTTADEWLFNGFRFCDVPLRLYCISQ
jgi:hypothetical protein